VKQVAAVTPSEPLSLIALGRRSLTYALGGLAYKGVALLALPILARLLSPAQLGLLDLAAVLAAVAGLVAVLGTDQGVAYLEPRAGSDSGLWGSVLVIVTVVGGVLAVVATMGSGTLAALLTGDAANAPVVVAAALYGWVMALTATAMNAIRLHGTPRTYAVASFMVVTAEMTAALTLAWVFDAPVSLMVLGWAGGALVVTVPRLLRFMPSFDRPKPSVIRRLVAFGAPLVPSAAAWLVGDAWIRAMLAQQGDLGALGEYGIAFRIASVLVLAVTGFGVAWHPYLYRSPAHTVGPRASSLLAVLVLVLGIGGAALTALAPEIIAVVAGPGYEHAREVVPAFSGGAVALGGFVLVSAVVGTRGSTRKIAGAALLGMLVQVAFAPMLIGSFGLAGAGLASFFGYAAAVVILLATERALLRSSSWRTLLAVGVSVAAIVLGAGLQEESLALRVAFVVGLAGLGAVILAATRTTRSRLEEDVDS
jgi:O-antigen/teichoic acid export membrane protein